MKNARYLSVSIAVLILDQITKYAIVHSRVVREPVVIVPRFLRLAHGENTGALFGMFATLERPLREIVLVIVPLLAIGLILLFMRMSGDRDRLSLLGLSLILGGALGNQIDRLVRGGRVVDFLDASIDVEPVRGWLVQTFGTSHWPAFNVADSSIVIGALLLVFDLLKQARPASTMMVQ